MTDTAMRARIEAAKRELEGFKPMTLPFRLNYEYFGLIFDALLAGSGSTEAPKPTAEDTAEPSATVPPSQVVDTPGYRYEWDRLGLCWEEMRGDPPIGHPVDDATAELLDKLAALKAGWINGVLLGSTSNRHVLIEGRWPADWSHGTPILVRRKEGP